MWGFQWSVGPFQISAPWQVTSVVNIGRVTLTFLLVITHISLYSRKHKTLGEMKKKKNHPFKTKAVTMLTCQHFSLVAQRQNLCLFCQRRGFDFSMDSCTINVLLFSPSLALTQEWQKDVHFLHMNDPQGQDHGWELCDTCSFHAHIQIFDPSMCSFSQPSERSFKYFSSLLFPQQQLKTATKRIQERV